METQAERERASFEAVQKWSAQRVVAWVARLDGGAHEAYAHAFARYSGKLLSVEYREDVAQSVRAAGGTTEASDRIYDEFRRQYENEKRASRAKARAAVDGSLLSRKDVRPFAFSKGRGCAAGSSESS